MKRMLLVLLALSHPAFAQDAVQIMAPTPAPSTFDALLQLLGGGSGRLAQILSLCGVIMPLLGLIYDKLEAAMEHLALYVLETPDPGDDQQLKAFMTATPYRWLQLVLAACNLPVLPSWEGVLAAHKQSAESGVRSAESNNSKLPIALTLLLPLLLFGGCGTPQQTAYRATGTVIVTVDHAMDAWMDEVVAGRVTPEREAAVQKLYDKYVAGTKAAEITWLAYLATAERVKAGLASNAALEEARARWRVVVENLGPARDALVELVTQYLPALKARSELRIPYSALPT